MRAARLTAHALIALAALCVVFAAAADSEQSAAAGIHRQVAAFFPHAERLGPFAGEPPAAAVYGTDGLLGYVLFTDQVAPIPAYSGKPIHTLVGVDLRGRITGVHIVSHEEPILGAGVSEAQLERFVAQYPGKRVSDRIKIGGEPREGYVTLDGLSGASITAAVFNASVMQAVAKVAEARGVQATEDARAAGDAEPIWRFVWQERAWEIGVLGGALAVLTLILFLQDPLARRPALLGRLRVGFLVFTLVFIGWYAQGQLSVVNVLTFVNAVFRDFHWELFLLDPVAFILWSFVALTLLLWGRGVYCGWLCPFGALQDLLYRAGKKLGLRDIELPQAVHERLWAVKYVVFLVLFAVALQSMTSAERLAEVEPFKTAITLRFQREWLYLLFPLALLAIGLFNRRFYCRYLCPLGASLTFPGRFRIFNWLRRRKECGRPCQICANECEMRAITATGEVNANECLYCLDCQATYWNSQKCPPLRDKRRRQDKAAGIASVPVRFQATAGVPTPVASGQRRL